jgi:hypothetical protein
MRLVMSIGYNKILFGKGAPIAALVEALDGVRVVSQTGYGDTTKYVVGDEVCPEVIIIPDDSVTLPENANPVLDEYHKVATERDTLRSKVRELEAKIKAIETAVKPDAKPE